MQVRGVLVRDRLDFLTSEVQQLMADSKYDELTLLYKVVSLVAGGTDAMVGALQVKVKASGLETISDKCPAAIDDAIVFCEAVIDVISRFRAIVHHCFFDDPQFVQALQSAAEQFMNRNAVQSLSGAARIADHVARYIDHLMRQPSAATDVDSVCDRALVLFRLLEDKDMFQKFYQKRLAGRLIGGALASEETELALIHRLRVRRGCSARTRARVCTVAWSARAGSPSGARQEMCGFEYTSKLLRMFSDVQMNDELNRRLLAFLAQHNRAMPMEFRALVLATGSWPLNPIDTPMRLPAAMDVALRVFEQWFHAYVCVGARDREFVHSSARAHRVRACSEHGNRKLRFLHQMSRGDLVYTSGDGVHYVIANANTFQIATFLQFSEIDELPFTELAQAVGFDEPVLRAALQSFVRMRLLVLTSGSASDASGVYALNREFKRYARGARATCVRDCVTVN